MRIEESGGYVWYWKKSINGGPGFFLPYSFNERMADAYKWARFNFGNTQLKKMRKNGFGIMRVKFVSDGWSK